MTEREKQLIKEARAAYARKWRKENPERAKEIQEQYWLRKIKAMQEATKESFET